MEALLSGLVTSSVAFFSEHDYDYSLIGGKAYPFLLKDRYLVVLLISYIHLKGLIFKEVLGSKFSLAHVVLAVVLEIILTTNSEVTVDRVERYFLKTERSGKFIVRHHNVCHGSQGSHPFL